MQQDIKLSAFDKSMLTGLFVGFICTLICLAYNVIYRGQTGFTPSSLINVSSLIFAINLLFTIIGILYYGFLKAFKKGSLIFVLASAAFTIALLWKTGSVMRSDNPTINFQFRGLLGGIILIMGIGASLIPWLSHNRSFEEHVL